MILLQLFGRCGVKRFTNLQLSNRILKLTQNQQSYKPLLFRAISISGIPKPFGKKTEADLKSSDNVPKKYDLIYRAPLTTYFKLAHVIITVTAFLMPISVVLVAKKSGFKYPLKLTETLLLSDVLETCLFFGVPTTIGILTMVMVSRFPVRIYHDPQTNEYIASYISNLLFKPVLKNFKRGDVKMLPESDAFLLQISNYTLQNRKTIFVEEYFRRPADLNHMLDCDTKLEEYDEKDEEDKWTKL